MASKTAYGHLLSGTVKAFVESELVKPPEDQNSIQEELALLRADAGRTVRAYSRAVEAKEPKAIGIIGEIMTKQLHSVSGMAEKAARIQSSNKDQLTIAAVENIIGAIVEMIYDVLRLEPNGMHIAARIEKKIGSSINISAGDAGTVRLPSDDLVQSMDLSVPVEQLTLEEGSK